MAKSTKRYWKSALFAGALLLLALVIPGRITGNASGTMGCGGEEHVAQEESNLNVPSRPALPSSDDTQSLNKSTGNDGCQSGAFPKLMSYRSMSNKGDQLDVNTSFYTVGSLGPYYEYLHDIDIDKLNTVESSSRKDCYTSIYHGWFGQFNAKSADARWVFPGHWMFAKGTTLTADLDASSGTISVANTKVFTEGTYAMLHRKYGSSAKTYLSYSRWQGHNWKNVEYVKVTGVAKDGTSIKVERNVTPRDTSTTYMYAAAQQWTVANTAGDVYIAPLAFRTKEVDLYHDAWRINMALDSPRAEIPNTHDVSLDMGATSSTVNGLKGWRFYAYYSYLRTFKDQGQGLIEGIQFDEAQYMAGDVTDTLPYHAADVDNDLNTDFGYDSTGLNSYGVGTVKSMKLLRKILTDNGHTDFILQADSSTVELGYRGFDFLNGIEIENFPDFGAPKKWNKAWYESFNRFSSAIQHLLTYVEETGKTQYPAFSYPHTKEATFFYQAETLETDGSISSAYVSDNYYFRIGMMSALLAGMPHSYKNEVSAYQDSADPENQTTIKSYVDYQTATLAYPFYQWDEYLGGKKQDADWLGQPASNWKRVTNNLERNDYLSSSSLVFKVFRTGENKYRYYDSSHATATGGEYQVSYTSSGIGGTTSIDITQVPPPDYYEFSGYDDVFLPGMRGLLLEMKPVLDKSKSYSALTLRFTAKAKGDGYHQSLKIPNMLRAQIKMTTFNEATNSSTTKALDQYIHIPSTSQDKNVYFTFLPNSQGKITDVEWIKIYVGEEVAEWTLSEFSLVEGSADRFYRHFDNGIALLNMAFTQNSSDQEITRKTSGVASGAGVWELCIPYDSSAHKGYCKIDGSGSVTESNGANVNDGSKANSVPRMTAVQRAIMSSAGLPSISSKTQAYSCFSVPEMDGLLLRHCD